MAETNLALFPAMCVIPSVEIEADAVLRLTLLPQSASHFHQRGRGGREIGREGRRGGREGWRDGGMEGGREEGREGGGVLSQWKEGPLSVFQQLVFKLDIYSVNTCIIYIAP